MFICEGCGKVFEDDCPKCPDRGNGRGVTVERIKNNLRSCKTIGDVNTTAQHYRGHVYALDQAGGAFRTQAIQIRNLAAYMRWKIDNPIRV